MGCYELTKTISVVGCPECGGNAGRGHALALLPRCRRLRCFWNGGHVLVAVEDPKKAQSQSYCRTVLACRVHAGLPKFITSRHTWVALPAPLINSRIGNETPPTHNNRSRGAG